jgi:hypothetical protein
VDRLKYSVAHTLFERSPDRREPLPLTFFWNAIFGRKPEEVDSFVKLFIDQQQQVSSTRNIVFVSYCVTMNHNNKHLFVSCNTSNHTRIANCPQEGQTIPKYNDHDLFFPVVPTTPTLYNIITRNLSVSTVFLMFEPNSSFRSIPIMSS